MTSRDRRAATVVRLLLVFTMALAAWPHPVLADLMIIGNDEKVVFDAEGNRSVARPARTRSPSWTSRIARRRRSSSAFR